MHAPVRPPPGLGTALDILLADIAIRLQLSQTAHAKAVARYEAIRKWIEREGSPLAGLVDLFYAQGSMAIGATIASRVTNDEYDLDVVVQLRVPWGWSPKQVLDTLYTSIRGAPGSRYYDMVQLRPRCVTVSYSDMHLDLIPMERRPRTRERESDLFVHQSDGVSDRSVVNSFGFAEWFNEQTADTGVFGPLFSERASKYEYQMALARADAEPVPEQEPASEKALPIIGLQLLKRWRNVLYQSRSNGRPPSVLLSKFAADQAGASQSLSEELLHQAVAMRDHFRRAESMGTLIRVVNPVCAQDVLTDRWPADRGDQQEFLRDIERLIASVEWLRGDRDLEEIRRKLAELFGEWPAGKAVEAFNQQRGEEIGQGRSRHHKRTGSIALTGAATGAAAPRHKFYGGVFHRR